MNNRGFVVIEALFFIAFGFLLSNGVSMHLKTKQIEDTISTYLNMLDPQMKCVNHLDDTIIVCTKNKGGGK